MHIVIPDPDRYYSLRQLTVQRDQARKHFFDHRDPGGLTPAEKKAWEFEHFALQLVLQAAQIKLEAEEEMIVLLRAETAA